MSAGKELPKAHGTTLVYSYLWNTAAAANGDYLAVVSYAADGVTFNGQFVERIRLGDSRITGAVALDATVAHDATVAKDATVARQQPLILDYDLFRPETFTWINIFSRMDIVSGHLNYYDLPSAPGYNPVDNRIDREAWFPIFAHTQYWKNKALHKALYEAVLNVGTPQLMGAPAHPPSP